jgi:hypothetical protein
MSDHLPPATIITFPGKMTAIISLSCSGICGEDYFRYLWLKKARFPAEWQESLRTKCVDIFLIWKVFGPVITVGS